MKNLTIRVRIILIINLIILLFTFTNIFSYIGQNKIENINNEMISKVGILTRIQELNYSVTLTDDYGAWYVLSATTEGQQIYSDKYQKNMEVVSQKLNDLQKVTTDSENKKCIEAFQIEWTKYLQANDDCFKVFKSGNVESAQAMYTQIPFEPVISSLLKYQENQKALIETQKSVLENTKTFMHRIIVTTIIIAMILGIVISYLFSKSISKSLGLLKKEFETLANSGGDLTQEIAIDSKDEIADLARTINEFLAKLRVIISQVKNNSNHIADASQHLMVSSEQAAYANRQIVITMSSLTQGAEEQAISIDETSTATEQISAGITQIASKVESIQTLTNQTRIATLNGQKAVHNTIQQMKDIGTSASDTQEAFTKLNTGSEQISEIAQIIANIADQTNLLALNASIEAARAGEQGRGFAVVADEVRKLAEQSQGLAKQIAERVTQNNVNIKEAVCSMDEASNNVKTGIVVVDHAEEAFGDIANLVNQVANEITEIASEIQQMAFASGNIATSMHGINQISNEAAAETELVSASNEQQSTALNKIVSSIQSMSDLAEGLQDSVGKFKV